MSAIIKMNFCKKNNRFHRISKVLYAGLLSSMILGLNACSPVGVATGLGSAAGNIALSERGAKEFWDDTYIELALVKDFIQNDIAVATRVGINVFEGRVLLHGAVETEARRRFAEHLAWQREGVREVINEIQTDINLSYGDQAVDKFLEAKANASLLADYNVPSLNITLSVVNSTIYILGVGLVPQDVITLRRNLENVGGVRAIIVNLENTNDPDRLAWLKKREEAYLKEKAHAQAKAAQKALKNNKKSGP